MMTERKVSRTVVQEETISFPAEYGYDDSKRGKIVDHILRHDGYNENRDWPREDVYDDDADKVAMAIARLKGRYRLADEIMLILGVEAAG